MWLFFYPFVSDNVDNKTYNHKTEWTHLNFVYAIPSKKMATN